jgi:DNA-directed RNA polymerase subunit RPC12/RpoP
METDYTCSKCFAKFGEGVALRSIDLHKELLCIDCGVSKGEKEQAEKDLECALEFWEGEECPTN